MGGGLIPIRFSEAVRRAAENLRNGGDDGAGLELAALIRSGETLNPAQREMLADLVSDRLLPERKPSGGRPKGALDFADKRLAVVIDYLDRKKNAKHGEAATIKTAVAKDHIVSESRLEQWLTEYNKSIRTFSDKGMNGEVILRRIPQNSK